MGFDLDRVLRTHKPEKRRIALSLRPPEELVAASSMATRRPILADSTVYVHAGQGKLPPSIATAVQDWPLWHCSVVLGEIAHGIGRLDPSHPKTPQNRAYLEDVLRQIPQHRILTPDDDIHVNGGILTGILSRLLGLPKGAHRQRVNDVLIYLTARKSGAAVITANLPDFDVLQQIAPGGDVIYYVV